MYRITGPGPISRGGVPVVNVFVFGVSVWSMVMGEGSQFDVLSVTTPSLRQQIPRFFLRRTREMICMKKTDKTDGLPSSKAPIAPVSDDGGGRGRHGAAGGNDGGDAWVCVCVCGDARDAPRIPRNWRGGMQVTRSSIPPYPAGKLDRR